MAEPRGERGPLCHRCLDGRWVCEAHPARPGPCGVGPSHPECCPCGGACMPCPSCNHPSTWRDDRPTVPPGFVLDQLERNN